MAAKSFTLISSAVLAMSSLATAAPQPRDTALSLTAQVSLADSAIQRYSILSDDKDFVYNFNESTALFADRSSFPALAGLGGSMAFADFPPCSIGFLHLHPRATELFVVVSGHVTTEMIPEAGVVDASGNPRVIKTDLHPREMTIFPPGSFHTQLNPECEPAVVVTSFTSEDPGAGAIVGQVFSLTDDVIESAFGQSVNSQDIDRIRQALPKTMSTNVDACLAKCGLKKRAH
ncbi:hypothetical protein Trco_004588 [Trichoderma cornu-damae]|uniref:Cupin type-1 domain-containing protein n=1 Tax=Trichoderma cornu-damae TaxID=654480 RepID=A0A9P8QMV1_9HYPO|nr:hypothetical protein Trco_004588 [Trichoderma cornu-damae]